VSAPDGRKATSAGSNGPQFEIVDGVWIDVDGPAGFELRRRIAQGVEALDTVVTCAMVRDAVAPSGARSLWRCLIPQAGEDAAHLFLRPTGAGFSGIDHGTEAIAAAIRIDGVTEIRSGPPPATLSPLELPAARTDRGTGANTVEINLPVRLGYDRLAAELNRALGGREFVGQTPAGEVRLTVEEVTVYPSGAQACRRASGLPPDTDRAR
jgi:hypothetical protein